jgi:hypothetical protein
MTFRVDDYSILGPDIELRCDLDGDIDLDALAKNLRVMVAVLNKHWPKCVECMDTWIVLDGNGPPSGKPCQKCDPKRGPKRGPT